MTPTLPTLSGLLQVAYVTTDVEAAIDLFRTRHGVAQWARLCPIEIESLPGRTATLNIALAYAGAVQIELIQPLAGHDKVYREPLPDSGFALRFHHLAQLIDTEEAYERLRREVAAQGVRIAVEGESPGMARYFYGDHRDTLGHYIEHIHYSPAGLAALAQLPRN
jgi:catechol 2,3-dioxygenase-like lactoylglutathione lyase family enzyme